MLAKRNLSLVLLLSLCTTVAGGCGLGTAGIASAGSGGGTSSTTEVMITGFRFMLPAEQLPCAGTCTTQGPIACVAFDLAGPGSSVLPVQIRYAIGAGSPDSIANLDVAGSPGPDTLMLAPGPHRLCWTLENEGPDFAAGLVQGVAVIAQVVGHEKAPVDGVNAALGVDFGNDLATVTVAVPLPTPEPSGNIGLGFSSFASGSSQRARLHAGTWAGRPAKIPWTRAPISSERRWSSKRMPALRLHPSRVFSFGTAHTIFRSARWKSRSASSPMTSSRPGQKQSRVHSWSTTTSHRLRSLGSRASSRTTTTAIE
jgi:hypothetical protein